MFLNPFNTSDFNNDYMNNYENHKLELEIQNKDYDDRVRLYRVNGITDLQNAIK